jgi:peptide/nickel transport system substrate-binding protein
MITRRTLIRSGFAAAAAGLYAPSLRAQGMADTIRAAFAAGGPRKADPNQTTQGADNWATEQMFEQLVRPADGDFGKAPDEFFPLLAESWTSSDDSKTWTFTLRQGVQFHKGYGEMTAEDVVHSFDRAMTSGTAQAIYGNIAGVAASGPLR